MGVEAVGRGEPVLRRADVDAFVVGARDGDAVQRRGRRGGRRRVETEFGETVCRAFCHNHLKGVPLAFLRRMVGRDIVTTGAGAPKAWRAKRKIGAL